MNNCHTVHFTRKPIAVLMLLFSIACLSANAQSERSVFRKGYLRLGINSLGGNLDNSLSPKDNVFAGKYGAGSGFALEAGRIFYFRRNSPMINYGLDWTTISFTYNSLNKWKAYGAQSGAADISIDDPSLAGSISSKLGPVLSINPVEKLVIDVRVQAAYTVGLLKLDYSENYGQPDQRSFGFASTVSDGSGEQADVKAVAAGGLGFNAGISIRRKAIGLAIDYMTNKLNAGYDAADGSGHTSGKQKIPFKNFQVKLSFTL